jgi:hypothetical protein
LDEERVLIIKNIGIAAVLVAGMAIPAVAAGSAAASPDVSFSAAAQMLQGEDVPAGGVTKSDVHTGPSEWEGRQLMHPNGTPFPSEVTRWANMVEDVMVEQGIPDEYLEGILAQIQQESGGDPKAVNGYDSNALNGDPSKGLLQVIGSTYQAYALAGHEDLKYQDVPYPNVSAALSYVKDSHGMGKFASWNAGANQGY